MIRRKLGLMVLPVLIATVLFTTSASAVEGFYTCTVKGAGPGWGGAVYVLLEDTQGQFDARWFKADSSIGSKQLATALTAMTNDWAVLIYSDPMLTQENRILSVMYIILPPK
jgi:hypothetical protein